MKKFASTIYWLAIAACGLVLLNYTSYVKPQWLFFGIAAAIGVGICIYKSIKNENYVAQTLAMPKNIFVSAITVSSVAVKHKPTKTNKTAYKDAIAMAIKFFLVM